MTDYAGDITVQQAWNMLEQNDNAVLVDCRTTAEWSFVGVPELSSIGKKPVLIEWQTFPSMDKNDSFTEQLESDLNALGATKDTPVLFLCRSGQRSRSAAIALTARGFSACHNVAGGFEGDINQDRHRGQLNGWKQNGLPWVQS